MYTFMMFLLIFVFLITPIASYDCSINEVKHNESCILFNDYHISNAKPTSGSNGWDLHNRYCYTTHEGVNCSFGIQIPDNARRIDLALDDPDKPSGHVMTCIHANDYSYTCSNGRYIEHTFNPFIREYWHNDPLYLDTLSGNLMRSASDGEYILFRHANDNPFEGPVTNWGPYSHTYIPLGITVDKYMNYVWNNIAYDSNGVLKNDYVSIQNDNCITYLNDITTCTFSTGSLSIQGVVMTAAHDSDIEMGCIKTTVNNTVVCAYTNSNYNPTTGIPAHENVFAMSSDGMFTCALLRIDEQVKPTCWGYTGYYSDSTFDLSNSPNTCSHNNLIIIIPHGMACSDYDFDAVGNKTIVEGCLTSSACTYNSSATVHNPEMCVFPYSQDYYCMPTTVINDMYLPGICKESGQVGWCSDAAEAITCTDSDACNSYNNYHLHMVGVPCNSNDECVTDECQHGYCSFKGSRDRTSVPKNQSLYITRHVDDLCVFPLSNEFKCHGEMKTTQIITLERNISSNIYKSDHMEPRRPYGNIPFNWIKTPTQCNIFGKCNYDPYATENYECGEDLNHNGICDHEESNYKTFVCGDRRASNYRDILHPSIETHTMDISICEYPSHLRPGCLDPNACNFDANATINNYLCVYPQPNKHCDFTPIEINIIPTPVPTPQTRRRLQSNTQTEFISRHPLRHKKRWHEQINDAKETPSQLNEILSQTTHHTKPYNVMQTQRRILYTQDICAETAAIERYRSLNCSNTCGQLSEECKITKELISNQCTY